MNRAPTLQAFDQNETRHRPEHNGPDYDYKEIAREVLARIDQRLGYLERDASSQPAETQREEQAAEASGEAASEFIGPDDEAAFRLRGLFALVASTAVVAAVVWLWFHGDTARHLVAGWTSPSVASSAAPEEKPQAGADAGSPSASNALAAAAPMQAAAPTQAATPPRMAADNDRPAPIPPELAEQMRKVDRNVAGLAQAVNELRTALQQVSDNNAKAVEEVRASVDQLARTVVRVEQAEQAVQPKVVPPAPTPRTATPAPGPRAAVPPQRNRRSGPIYMSPYDAEAQFLR